MVSGALLARCMQEFCGSFCGPTHFGHVRRLGHSGLLDRQFYVLHEDGTNLKGWILVCVAYLFVP